MRATRVHESITKSLKKSRIDITELMQSVAELNINDSVVDDPDASRVSEAEPLAQSRALSFTDLIGGGATNRYVASPAIPPLAMSRLGVSSFQPGYSQLLFASELPAHAAAAAVGAPASARSALEGIDCKLCRISTGFVFTF